MPSIRKVAHAAKRAAKAFGPGKYVLAGKPVVCPHCGSRIQWFGKQPDRR